MIFGEVPVEETENAVLAHTLRVESLTIKKGVPLSAAERALLKEWLDRLAAATD